MVSCFKFQIPFVHQWLYFSWPKVIKDHQYSILKTLPMDIHFAKPVDVILVITFDFGVM